MHDEMQPQEPQITPEPGADAGVQLPTGEVDHEGAMAKADLYKLANYSLKLFKQVQDGDQLESWVQAKITKAADYIASVYHYLEYEMKFSDYGHHLDNSDTLSEGQKAELKNKLMEAKSKVSELKKAQAEKQSGHTSKKIKEEVSKEARNQQPDDSFDEKVKESSGDEEVCPSCHGTGHIAKPERVVPEATKEKVRNYNRKAKAFHAASKRIDANKNGIPDDEEVDEDFEGLNKSGDTAKTSQGGTVTKTSTGIRHTADASKFTDEPHTEPKSIAKSKSASEKKAEKDSHIKLPKDKNAWGIKGGEKFGHGAPKAKKEKEVDETYGQGIYSEAKKSPKAKKDWDKDGKIESEKDEVIGSRRKAAGLDEAKAKPDFLDMDNDGNKKEPMKKAIKDKKVSEAAKPSAGLTKGEKSATVKAAKKGEDIGKPGKGFAKVAAKAAKEYGSKEKGEKVAAAAMWKNKAKATIKESLDRELSEGNMSEQEFMDRLNKIRATNPQALQNALNSTDPMALNKLIGFKMSPGEKLAPAMGDDDQGTLGQPAKTPAVVRESAELDRMKEFLTRLNG